MTMRRFLLCSLLLLAAPGLAAAVEPRAETEIARLTREAMENPTSLSAWDALARALRALRPSNEAPSSAEKEAVRIVQALAAQTPGAITEIRLDGAGERTEVFVRASSLPRYRLFHRFRNTNDPRLTLVFYDAVPVLLEPRYTGLGVGDIEELRVTATDSGTVEIAISLPAEREFTMHERDGGVVVSIENRTSPSYAAWGSLPTWARTAVAAALPESPVTQIIERARAQTEAEAVTADEILVEERAATTALSTAAADALGWLRGIELPARDLAAGAAFIAVVVLAATVVARRQRTPRPAPRAKERVKAPKRTKAAATRTATAPPADSRLWAARALASSGAPSAEIARRTRLAQDAVSLIAQAAPPSGGAEEVAAPGTFFRTPAHPTASAESTRRGRKLLAVT